MMTQFDNLLYLSFGVAVSFPPQTSIGMGFEKVRESTVAPIVQIYSQNYAPLTTSVYTIKDSIGFPKRNYYQRYKAIAESSWFERDYKGKSLGDFIDVDY